MRLSRICVAAGIVCVCAVNAGAQVQLSQPPPPPVTFTACPASTEDIPALVRAVVSNDEVNAKRARDYTYTEHEIQRDIDKHGQVRKTSSQTHEIMILDDEYIEKLVAKDDKPLPANDAQKEDERINKWMEKRKNESPEDKKNRLAKEEKEREKDREFEREIADAYNFKLLPEEAINGRDAYVIEAEPKAGFVPHTSDAKILPKFRFHGWIDKSECQLVKLDASVIDTVSVGFFIARLYPGSSFMLQQARINDEVWLPSHIDLRVEARVLLVKGFNEKLAFDYSDYKKFRSSVQIVPAATDH